MHISIDHNRRNHSTWSVLFAKPCFFWQPLRTLGNASLLAAVIVSGALHCALAAESGSREIQLERLGTRLAEVIWELGRHPTPTSPAKVKMPGAPRDLQEVRAQAGGDVQVYLRPGNGTVMQIRGRSLKLAPKGVALQKAGLSHERAARELFFENRELMRLSDPEAELELTESVLDELGHRHLRFRQRYKAIPVWPGRVNAHFDSAGNLTAVDGAYVPTPDLDAIEPALDAAAAVARAKSALGLLPGAATANNEQLVIYGSPHTANPSRLAWKFELTASLTETWLVFIDAQNGAILHQSPRVCEGAAQGSGIDLFGARLPLQIWEQGTSYYLADTSKGAFDPAFDPILDPHGVITVADARNATLGEVQQNGSQIVTSHLKDLWDVPAAISAAYNISLAFDYFLLKHGRNSLDGEGGNVTAVVRVGQYDNAIWVPGLQAMYFGQVQPWAGSIDMVGHELTHGVTEHTARLVYSGQAGALSEAFSDIFGEMVEASSTGKPDWLMASKFNRPLRNFKDPGALTYPNTGRGYPAAMSEFEHLPNDAQHDWGGVHGNSSIINHCYYLLAEGLSGGVGLRKAESIFYRCLNQHLFAQSEFVDCRLGCVTAAEELYGQNSTEARLTAEAFDAVEIFAAPATPEPTPLPAVSGPDSALFVAYDFWTSTYTLSRREAALNDGEKGTVLASSVSLIRPAVTGDGSIALYVSPEFDLCAVNTGDPNVRKCLGFPGLVHSATISPNGRFAGFVLRNVDTGEPERRITVLDLAVNTSRSYDLVAPASDGLSVDSVLFADALMFSTDSSTLVYDALTQLKFGNGPLVQRWSIYSLNLESGRTSTLVAPHDGVDTGNPALGRAGNRYMAYDYLDAATGVSSIMVLDLFTGQTAEVAKAPGGFALPYFLGDESGVVYSVADSKAVVTGRSLFKQSISSDRLHASGDPALWYRDANLGVIYRRGEFTSTNLLPQASLALSSDSVSAPGTVILTATATDPDGEIARIDFYDGSVKLAQVVAPPYTFVWQNIPAGNHLVVARAVDNLVGTKDSAPRLLTVTGDGNANPTVILQVSDDTISAQGSVTLTATANDPDGTIARVEFYDDATRIGSIEAPPYVFLWENVPAGNHLLSARAFDTRGGTGNSVPRFLTASGTSNPGHEQPKLAIRSLAPDKVRLTVTGAQGYYIIAMSEDLKTWADIHPVTVGAGGSGVVEDSGGPLNYARLFYRVHRDE